MVGDPYIDSLNNQLAQLKDENMRLLRENARIRMLYLNIIRDLNKAAYTLSGIMHDEEDKE